MDVERMPEKQYLYGASVIIGKSLLNHPSGLLIRPVEGIMTLVSPELRDLYDLKVFVVRLFQATLRRHGSPHAELRLGPDARAPDPERHQGAWTRR